MNRTSKRRFIFPVIAIIVAVLLLLIRDEKPLHKAIDSSTEPQTTDTSGESLQPESSSEAVRTMTALTFVFSENGVALADQREISAFAKTQRRIVKEGNVYYRVQNSAEQTIWEATSPNPRKIHYDSVDEDGQLTGGVTLMPEGEYTLRIPELSDAKKVEIFDYTESESGVPIFALDL